MGKKQKSNPFKNDAQKKRTAQNKIKAVEKALLIAGTDAHKQKLQQRLAWWQSGGKK